MGEWDPLTDAKWVIGTNLLCLIHTDGLVRMYNFEAKLFIPASCRLPVPFARLLMSPMEHQPCLYVFEELVNNSFWFHLLIYYPVRVRQWRKCRVVQRLDSRRVK